MLLSTIKKEKIFTRQQGDALKILVVTPNPARYDGLARLLVAAEGSRITTAWCRCNDDAAASVVDGEFDLCVIDGRLLDTSAIKFVEFIQQTSKTLPFIILAEPDEIAFRKKLNANAPVLIMSAESLKGNELALYIQCALKLGAQSAEIERVRQEGEKLVAHMAHDLRTPINAVMGFSELLILDFDSGLVEPRHKQYLEMILHTSDHMSGVIDNILDAAKAASGKVVIKNEALDLRVFIEGCAEMLSPMADNAMIEINVSVPQNFPNIMADRYFLQRVLVNLIGNAIKFTRDGGSIDIEAVIDNYRCAQIKIIDSGIGMRTPDIASALTPFGQVDGKVPRACAGTGLGLPLSQSLMEYHGGRLEIESAVDRGTTVTLHFPAERTNEAVMAC